jgi:hypothetical protein
MPAKADQPDFELPVMTVREAADYLQIHQGTVLSYSTPVSSQVFGSVGIGASTRRHLVAGKRNGLFVPAEKAKSRIEPITLRSGRG